MIIGLIVLALAAGYVVGAWVMSGMILHASRRSLQQAAEACGYATPADFRQPYADMQVVVGTETIRGWLVRAEPASRRAVILIHGLGDNRVGMLPLLPVVEPLGVNVALIDLRAHGESDGAILTYGVREREAVKGVIDWLIDRDLAQSGEVALVAAKPQAYQEHGRFKQPDRSKIQAWPHPVIANGGLYLRDQAVLLCYDIGQNKK